MEEGAKVFSSDITREQKSLQHSLYDLLNVVPAQPLAAKEKKEFICDFQPKIDKYYTPKKRSKLKVKTVRNVRDVFEKDIYRYLPNDLEKQQNVLLKKITAGSSRDEGTQILANNLIKSKNPISRSAWQMLMNLNPEGHSHCIQFVLWNGKRIRVNGSKGGKSKFLFNYDLANKKLPLQAKSCRQNKGFLKKKGMLRNSLSIKFKPGPLTKKKFLDDSYQKYNVGDTDLVNLPKPVLELQPTYGVVVEPTIANFLYNLHEVDGKITEKWAEFAVSVLGTSNNTSVVQNEAQHNVTFEINYKSNLRRILMRRDVCDSKFEIKENYNATNLQPPISDELTITSEVRTVINNLINSVEISLQQEDMYSGEDDPREFVQDDNPNNNANNFQIKEKFKRNTELDRLDVTIIRLPNVPQGENIETCRKSHCSLGCVCSSLQCDYKFKQHCGRIECMFECKCDFSKYKVAESLENDCSELIPGLINLDNKINLGLAKEEQKFHQTVVLTGEKSILLKSQKRHWKATKRYEDFYSNMNLKADVKTERVLSIIAVKLKCENIEPWCMVHNLYQCFCEGKFTDSIPDKICELTDINKTTAHKEEKPDNLTSVNDKEIIIKSTRNCCPERSRTNLGELSVSKYSMSEFTNLPNSTCARTNPYKGRKYYDSYYFSTNRKILEMEKNDVKLHAKMISLISNMEIKERNELGDSDNFIESNHSDDISRNASSENEDILKSQSQSTFDLSRPPSIDDARVNEEQTPSAFSGNDNAPDRSQPNICSKPTPTPKKPSIISWLESNYRHYKERLERGVVKTSLDPPVIGKMGLYPWEFILNRYKERKNLFLTTKKHPFRIFMAVDAKDNFFDNCINIDDIRFADLHKYPAAAKNLLTNATDLKDNFCILRGLTQCWEWIGSANVKDTADSVRSPKKTLNPDPRSNQAQSCTTSTRKNKIFPDNMSSGAEVIDYDVNENNENATEAENVKVQTSKWFVMTVENDFSEIQFKNRGFYVKYESIIKSINVANMSGKTVCLSSQKCTEQNSGPQFGIYAIPNANEYCVFVGPYEQEEPLGIEILKSISHIQKRQRTRGVWITSKKVDNLNVIENPLSFIPKDNSNSGKLVPLESDITSNTTGEKLKGHTDTVVESNKNETLNSPKPSKTEVIKCVKPIKIRRTNGFYHLAPKSFLKQITSPSVRSLLREKQTSMPGVDLPQICLQNPKHQDNQNKTIGKAPPLLIINPVSLLKSSTPVASTSENIITQHSILNVGNKRPVAEIAPQIKIIDVYSESGTGLENKNVETKKPEGGMFVLKPEEINKRLMQNKALSTKSENDSIHFFPESDMNTDIENFLATSKICTLRNSDIYIISDDEEASNDGNKSIGNYEEVMIECKNIENLGWIRGRRNSMDELSFEFPGFKYTDFYTAEEAFSKINQVLSRKIYVHKSLNLEWQVIESEEELKTKHQLKPEVLGPDYILTKRGPRHKKDLVTTKRKRKRELKTSTITQISETDETRPVALDENKDGPVIGVDMMPRSSVMRPSTAKKRKSWDPEKMKRAIEAVRNNTMGYKKAVKAYSVPMTTLKRLVKESMDLLVSESLNELEKQSTSLVNEGNMLLSEFKNKGDRLSLFNNVSNSERQQVAETLQNIMLPIKNELDINMPPVGPRNNS